MASKIVQVPGVGNVEFPDSMSDDQISAAITSHQSSSPQQTTVQPGMWDRIKSAALDPLMDSLGGGANMTARALMSQATGDPMLYDTIRASQKQGPTVADSKHPFMYGVKQAVGGMAADTADTAAGFTSPVSLATAGMGVVGKGTGAAAKLAQMGTKAIGTGFALKGTADVTDAATNPDLTPAERAQEGFGGGAMMAGGYAGAAGQPKYGELAKQFANKVKGGFNDFAVKGTPSELLVRATKPTVGLPDYEESLNRTVPKLFEQSQAQGKPILNLTDLENSANALKADAHSQYRGLLDEVKTPIDGQRIADAQMGSIPATNLREDPSIVGRTKSVASTYLPKVIKSEMSPIVDEFGRPIVKSEEINQQMFAPEAEAIHVDTNAKLRSFFNKQGGDKFAALSNPETARTFAVNQGVKSSLYDAIEKATGEDPRPYQEAYGDATDIADTAGRRDTVFSRQQPIPLGQQISDAQALANGKPGQAVLARMFKRFNDSNWLTKEAFERVARQQEPQVKGKFPYGSLAASFAASRR